MRSKGIKLDPATTCDGCWELDTLLACGERDEATGCLLWMGARSTAGYGQTRCAHRLNYVHRVSWALANGPIPAGLWVLHRCDTPPCYEPSHLFSGTAKDNGRDMASKGRAGLQRHPENVKRGADFIKPPGWIKRGEDNPKTTLTEDDVRAIRRLYAAGTRQVALAAQFGITQTGISLIVTRKNWAHVE
jgi:hypothetical protein